MVIFNSTFFFHPSLATEVRRWLGTMWIPAAEAAGMNSPLALSMEPMPGQEEVERLAIQAYFPDRAAADAFAAREAALLADELATRFGREAVMVLHTVMTRCEL